MGICTGTKTQNTVLQSRFPEVVTKPAEMQSFHKIANQH